MHMHTPYSDGEGSHREIAAAAARAGLDVVIATDHNVLVPGVDGYDNGVLVLAGEEVHDEQRVPQVNHCLVYDACDEMVAYAPDPQALLNEVGKRGGLSFLAHPVEYGSPISRDLDPIPWADWDVRGFNGIEIWNTMSEFKARLWNYPMAILAAYLPSLVIFGPFRETLRRWDELLSSGLPVVAIGNADAHGTHTRLGPLRRVVLPYDYLFRCVNTHLLIDRPLTRDLETDRRLIFKALRAGHCFVAYDLSAPARGFTFTARSGEKMAIMGDELVLRGEVHFEISCPARGAIRLLRDGQVMAVANGRKLIYTGAQAGVYRVEVHRRFRFANRGWIFSNPIYVR